MGHAPNWPLAARVVAEHRELGTTVPALAQKYERSRECVRSWLNREAEGLKTGAGATLADFSALCRRERDSLQVEKERRRKEWADVCVTALRNTLEALAEAGRVSRDEFATGKIEKGRIRELAGAVKIMAEANLTGKTLFGDSDGADKKPPDTNPVH